MCKSQHNYSDFTSGMPWYGIILWARLAQKQQNKHEERGDKRRGDKNICHRLDHNCLMTAVVKALVAYLLSLLKQGPSHNVTKKMHPGNGPIPGARKRTVEGMCRMPHNDHGNDFNCLDKVHEMILGSTGTQSEINSYLKKRPMRHAELEQGSTSLHYKQQKDNRPGMSAPNALST